MALVIKMIEPISNLINTESPHHPKDEIWSFIRCQQSMLSKRWLGAECTQYSELSVIILGEPPPSDT